MLITDIAQTFKQGKALANPGLWANSTSAAGVLSGFLIGGFHVAKAFGYDFGESDAQLTQIAGGVAALVVVVTNILHTLSNAQAGVPTTSETKHQSDSDALGGPSSDPG
jgi:hypothetical protein